MNVERPEQPRRVLHKSIVPTMLAALMILAWVGLTSPLRVTSAQAALDASATPTALARLVIASSFGANMLDCARADCETIAFLEYGTELDLIGSEVGWFNVRTADGSTGFVPDFLVMPLANVTPIAPSPPALTGCAPPVGWSIYSVQPGDTLADIARRAGTSTDQLVQVNCLANANVLAVGQFIYVPQPISPRANGSITLVAVTPPPASIREPIVVPQNTSVPVPPNIPQNTLVSPQMTLIVPSNPQPTAGQPIIVPRNTAVPHELPPRPWWLPPTQNAPDLRAAP